MKKAFHLILLAAVAVFSISTIIFMIWTFSFEISIALSNPEMGKELLFNRIKLMTFPIFIMLFFWFLVNYMSNKTRQSRKD
ncbi:hypothetical protein ACQCWI_28085 [Bacillus thuringiensis]|uniref:hypothetical protein n=1 Tax=Bacillus thuringiensis TaxID=1428 RepID=UPI003CF03C36